MPRQTDVYGSISFRCEKPYFVRSDCIACQTRLTAEQLAYVALTDWNSKIVNRNDYMAYSTLNDFDSPDVRDQ